MEQIVVVGAGQAGSSLVARLRKQGFEGKIALIGAEPVPPYQRPPLSKAYLLGDMALERLYLRPERYYSENGIDLHLSESVVSIDRANKTVQLTDSEVSYDHLALTTGSIPRQLPASIGGDLPGVHVVRTLADVDAMEPGFREGAHALIVGGGYIGLEAAAVACKRGMKVTLIEMGERILQRVAAPETSGFFRDLHTKHGVDIRESTGLQRLIGEERVTGAVLGDGTEVPVDLVIVGIGIAPATELAEAAGLELENGIKVDAFGRSSDPSIWAAGDCASFPYKDGRIRLESVPNAIEQAEQVADNILGAETPYVAKPWFWSDQYDVKLQIAGLNTGYDSVVSRIGEGSASFWYFRGDELLAVDAMNDPRGYMIGKRLIEAGKSASKEILADPATDLKPLLKA